MLFEIGTKTKQRAALTLAATAAAVLLAACGGGGDGVAETPAPQASLQLSGTAATGLALANANVEIRCAAGTGSATTDASGAYNTAIAGATLPCMIRVSGTAGGVAVVLHSVAEAGSTANNVTTATANVTPLTEIIVAKLVSALPSASFEAFGSGSTVTSTQLTEATAAVLNLLKTAAGIDLGSIDPFKTTLVAATTSNPTGGNDYDKLLDSLGDLVSPEALPIIVTQVASNSGSTAALKDVFTGVGAGSLEGCAVAISGKYRTIDYTGESVVHTVDFKNKTWTSEGHTESVPIIPSTTQPCQFVVGDALYGATIVIGPKGAGAFRAPESMGYIFPVQAHTMASIAGKWNFMESGVNEDNQGEHFVGKFEVAADGKVTVCDYNVSGGVENFTTCNVDTEETAVVQAASDGGFALAYGDSPARVFGFQAPDGALTLFGTNNPSGSTEAGAFRTSFVMVRPVAGVVPAVGTVSKYWDLSINYNAMNQTLVSADLVADSNTVTAVTATSMTRTRASDSRVDTLEVNKPAEGLRYRAASTGISSIYQMQLPTLGMAVAIDNMSNHFFSVSVARP